jgi:hypothetical protein
LLFCWFYYLDLLLLYLPDHKISSDVPSKINFVISQNENEKLHYNNNFM